MGIKICLTCGETTEKERKIVNILLLIFGAGGIMAFYLLLFHF